MNGFDSADKFKKCILLDVIVTPSTEIWKIKLQTPENIDDKILSTAENFLSKKYLVNVKLSAEKIPVNEKIIDFEKFATEKIFGKKISEPITEISKLILDKKSVIVGEIFDIELREFKTGSSAITFS